ncbi:MAG TPA: MFS transporter [Tepidisphaeraceae bacterium]|jgi:MFS family permease|nr:MFS transporter [Tepidisphaeraceae bacterium]
MSSPNNPAPQTLRRTLSLITLAWLFGSVWFNATSGTPYTNFAKSLNCSAFEFGLLAAIPYLASLINIPASLLTEATGQRKLLFLLGLYGQRLLWIPIALVPLYMVHLHGVTRSATLTFLFLILIMQLSGAVGGPAWLSWMGDIVPTRAAGRYFAARRVWGTFSAIPSALVAGLLLDRYTNTAPLFTSMSWCAAILIVAALFGIADIATFHWVPEVRRPPQKGIHLLQSMRAPLHDRNFLRFGAYVATITFAISFMGQFVTLYILDMLSSNGNPLTHTNTLTQLMVIVAPSVAQLLVFPIWGRCADRMGKRPLLILAGLGLVPVAVGWCFVTAEHIWLGYVLSALGAAFFAGVEVANLNLVLELSVPGQSPGSGSSGYIAVNSVIVNLAGCLGGISSGLIAQSLQNHHFHIITPFKTFTFYDVLFLLSAVMRLLAIVLFIPFIHESTARPTHEALRFMTGNIYNNLISAAAQPARLLRSTQSKLKRG